jgi:hypothetical protein
MAGQQDIELQEMAEATQQLARAVVEEVRELIPSPSQWARARALHEAREWAEFTQGVQPWDELRDGIRGQQQIEAMAPRWATFIEAGEFPEGSSGE